MYLHFGTQTARIQLGRVADFCPICRNVRPFTLDRAEEYLQLYWLSFPFGTTVGHIAACCECEFETSIGTDRYQEISTNPSLDLDGLIRTTHPNVIERNAERLRLEENLRSNGPSTLNPGLRARLIREPFEAFAAPVQALYAKSKLDRRSRKALHVTLAVAFAGLLLPSFFSDAPQTGMIIGVGISFLLGSIGGLVTFILVVLGPRHRLFQRIAPSLARTLAPLRPSDAELEGCLDALRKKKLKLGRKLRVARLRDEIDRAAATPLESMTVVPPPIGG